MSGGVRICSSFFVVLVGQKDLFALLLVLVLLSAVNCRVVVGVVAVFVRVLISGSVVVGGTSVFDFFCGDVVEVSGCSGVVVCVCCGDRVCVFSFFFVLGDWCRVCY